MDGNKRTKLAPIFQAVESTLIENRAALNQSDEYNGNHGDHMVAIFDLAKRSAYEMSEPELDDPGQDLAEAMAHAGMKLSRLEDNGSAHVYARGLQCVAKQLGKRGVTLDELAAYAKSVLSEADEGAPKRSSEVLKALVSGIAAWNRQEAGESTGDDVLNMGALFDFGVAYMQAKQRGGSRVEVLAYAAASASPLARVPYRLESGKLVMGALLQALKSQAGGLSQPGRSAAQL